MEYIPRPLYAEKVAPFVDKQLIKVLTGQRRVGKSCIMRQLMDEIRKRNPDSNIIHVDKEQLSAIAIKDHISLYEYVEANLVHEHPNYLFIDEVQEIANFQLCLRSLLSENKCDIYCTGSNAKVLSGELATHLAGRYIEIHIHSLSYAEYLEFNKLENSDDSLMSYLTLGGMPYIHNLDRKKDIIYEYLYNVYSSILLKDVVARESIRNVSFLENLVHYVADNVGSLFSSNNISKYLKSQQIQVPAQTILNYLRALCNSFFIYKVKRAEVSGMKIFEIGEKYYFEDLGIRNAVIGINMRTDIGKLLENVVYIELLRHGYKVFVGKYGDKGIDFIAGKDGERIYLQVAYMIYDEQTRRREFDVLKEVNDNFPKYVITMDRLNNGQNDNGIKQIHLADFLLASDKMHI